MINIMYLVLMALLALNVSAEVMNAFTTLDEGNKNSIATVNEQLNTTVSGLESLLNEDSKIKFKPILPVVQEIQREVASYNTYVEGLRNQLIDMSGDQNGTADEGDYIEKGGHTVLRGLKNKDVTTRFLVLGDDGEGGNPGAGAELKDRTLQTRARLIELYSNLLNEKGSDFNRSEEEVATLIASASQNMPFGDGLEEFEPTDDHPTWESFRFGHMPVAAVLPLMSQMQSDLKVSEANLVNSLAELSGGKVVEVDNFFPVFEADRSYVIGGERLNAKVSVGAFASTLNPADVDLRVNGQRIPIGADGKGDFSLVASGSGPKTLRTSVSVRNPLTGEVKSSEGSFTYEVGRRSVAVAADKMNVFYIGVPNPITVSAAGVASSDVRVNASGANLSGSFPKYTVTASRPGDAKVSVTAGGQNLGSFDFRVKRIPDPIAKVGGEKGGNMRSNVFKAQRGLYAELENFDFDAKCNIAGYELVYVPKRADAVPSVNQGGPFNGKSRQLIDRAKPGDVFYMNNIRAKCPGDDVTRNIGTMVFNIQ